MSEFIRLLKSRLTKSKKVFNNDFHEFIDLKYRDTLSCDLEINFSNVFRWAKFIDKDNDWSEIRKLMANILIRESADSSTFIRTLKECNLNKSIIATFPMDSSYYFIHDEQFRNKNTKIFTDIVRNDLERISENEIFVINIDKAFLLKPKLKSQLHNQNYFYFLKIYLDLYSNPDLVHSSF